MTHDHRGVRIDNQAVNSTPSPGPGTWAAVTASSSPIPETELDPFVLNGPLSELQLPRLPWDFTFNQEERAVALAHAASSSSNIHEDSDSSPTPGVHAQVLAHGVGSSAVPAVDHPSTHPRGGRA